MCHNLPANGKQGPISEEIYQTLLTNKKQQNLDQVHAANIIMPKQTRITSRNTFLRYEIIVVLKKFKTGRVPYLGLELTMHVIKSQINLVRRSLSSFFPFLNDAL
jgi:hypothetical protein